MSYKWPTVQGGVRIAQFGLFLLANGSDVMSGTDGEMENLFSSVADVVNTCNA